MIIDLVSPVLKGLSKLLIPDGENGDSGVEVRDLINPEGRVLKP